VKIVNNHLDASLMLSIEIPAVILATAIIPVEGALFTRDGGANGLL
jgi:hypothetical protein